MQNLLDSTQIATVFLDDALRIRHFTPALTQLFPVCETDRGRAITQIVTDLDYTTIQADVAAVLSDGSVIERDLALKDGKQVFVMRIRPYRTPRNIEGVVITFVDITERKKAELALAERNIQLALAGKAALVAAATRMIPTGRSCGYLKAMRPSTACLRALSRSPAANAWLPCTQMI